MGKKGKREKQPSEGLTEENENLKEQLKEANKNLENMVTTLQDFKQVLSALKAQYVSAVDKNEELDTLNKLLVKKIKELNELLSQRNSSTGTVEDQRLLIQKGKQLEKAQSEKKILKRNLQTLKSDVNNLEAKLTSKEKELADKERKLADTLADLIGLKETHAQKKEQMECVVNAAKQELNVSVKAVKLLKVENAKLKEEQCEKAEEWAVLKSQLTASESGYKKLEDVNANLQVEIAHLVAELLSKCAENSNLESKLAGSQRTQVQINHLQEQVYQLQIQNEALAAESAYPTRFLPNLGIQDGEITSQRLASLLNMINHSIDKKYSCEFHLKGDIAHYMHSYHRDIDMVVRIKDASGNDVVDFNTQMKIFDELKSSEANYQWNICQDRDGEYASIECRDGDLKVDFSAYPLSFKNILEAHCQYTVGAGLRPVVVKKATGGGANACCSLGETVYSKDFDTYRSNCVSDRLPLDYISDPKFEDKDLPFILKSIIRSEARGIPVADRLRIKIIKLIQSIPVPMRYRFQQSFQNIHPVYVQTFMKTIPSPSDHWLLSQIYKVYPAFDPNKHIKADATGVASDPVTGVNPNSFDFERSAAEKASPIFTRDS